MPVEKFDDKIDFMPECPNKCDVELPPMTRHVVDNTPRMTVAGTLRWLVCCPKCYVAYYALKSTGSWKVTK